MSAKSSAKDSESFCVTGHEHSSSKRFDDNNNDSKQIYSSNDDHDDEDLDIGGESKYSPRPPKVEILSISYEPKGPALISKSLRLKIKFDLDRDVVAAYWKIKMLVDSCDQRIIKILGETEPEDYTYGDSEFEFYVDSIDVSGIPRSTLANSGLIMAVFVVDGEEVITVNMVVNVYVQDDQIYRTILNPLE